MARILTKLFSLIILIGLVVTPLSNAYLLDTETSIGNTVSAGCWGQPGVPELLLPEDNYVASASSAWNLNPVMDWDDSFVCPGLTVQYQYESYRNAGLTQLVYRSGWLNQSQIPAPGTPEQVYYWRVRAKASDGEMSPWSPAWKLTVDRTAPVTTLSYNGKIINEKIINGEFNGNLNSWSAQGEVNYTGGDEFTAVRPGSGGGMARIGHTADDGNIIWENKISQKISPGAKNLSFYYNFFSFDFGILDDPGIIVRLNDYNVFYLSASDTDGDGLTPNESGWLQASFDISQIADPVLEIIFYSGNTGDEVGQSWVYIDSVTTAEAIVPNGPLNLTATDNLTGVDETFYSFDGVTYTPGNSFDLSEVSTSTWVYYYSRDLAGNNEIVNVRRLTNDILPPAAIDDLEALSVSKQSVNLTWTVPAETTVYDLRYSLNPINEANFASAMPVPNPPAPRVAGDSQDFEVTGLDSAMTYYFAVKSGDAALNWSDLSNVVSDTTLDEISEDPDLNPGDVVINELMWMGTSWRAADEYLELRNMTDRSIDLSGWSVGGVTIPSGKSIPAHGYFLITNFDKDGSGINVDPDLVDSDLELDDVDLQVELYNGIEIIDTADNGEGLPAAGEQETYRSMERDATPGNGYDANVWHTCLDDSALMHSYWDSGRNDCGTPGRENLSQAPVAVGSMLKLFYYDHRTGFLAVNLQGFNQLKYTLIYDSNTGQQAISGQVEIGGQEQWEITDLLLGSCSTDSCVYHEGVTQINLTVELIGPVNRTLTALLTI